MGGFDRTPFKLQASDMLYRLVVICYSTLGKLDLHVMLTVACLYIGTTVWYSLVQQDYCMHSQIQGHLSPMCKSILSC